MAAREVVTSAPHLQPASTSRSSSPARPATAEFGVRDAQGRLPYHNWFVAFVPTHGDVSKPDSQLAIVGFAYNANTVGNSATEMVKYFLQIHFGVKHDLRKSDLMKIGDFYGGN